MYKQINEQTAIVVNGEKMIKTVSAVKAKKLLLLRLISCEMSSLIGPQIVKKAITNLSSDIVGSLRVM